MTEKELIITLLEKVPDNKMGYVLSYIQGITAGERQEKFFINTPKEISNEKFEDDEKYTLYEYMKECGMN